MQKIRPALERLNQAITRLEAHQRSQAETAAPPAAELAELELQCAHLRADVSALKKQKAELETLQRRAAQQVEKAMVQIDAVLEDA